MYWIAIEPLFTPATPPATDAVIAFARLLPGLMKPAPRLFTALKLPAIVGVAAMPRRSAPAPLAVFWTAKSCDGCVPPTRKLPRFTGPGEGVALPWASVVTRPLRLMSCVGTFSKLLYTAIVWPVSAPPVAPLIVTARLPERRRRRSGRSCWR